MTAMTRSSKRRRFRDAALYAAACGAATATGSSLVGLIAWWLTHHTHMINL
jgi:hypothetical protein